MRVRRMHYPMVSSRSLPLSALTRKTPGDNRTALSYLQLLGRSEFSSVDDMTIQALENLLGFVLPLTLVTLLKQE